VQVDTYVTSVGSEGPVTPDKSVTFTGPVAPDRSTIDPVDPVGPDGDTTDAPEISTEGEAEEQQLEDCITGTDSLGLSSRGTQQGAVSQEGAAGIAEEPDISVGAATDTSDIST
jgi:hypothetical protein